jgi:hypothetical protein
MTVLRRLTGLAEHRRLRLAGQEIGPTIVVRHLRELRENGTLRAWT